MTAVEDAAGHPMEVPRNWTVQEENDWLRAVGSRARAPGARVATVLPHPWAHVRPRPQREHGRRVRPTGRECSAGARGLPTCPPARLPTAACPCAKASAAVPRGRGGVGAAARQAVPDAPHAALQVLRLAEAHIKHEKEELKSLNVVLERNKQDSDQRYMALEARMRATEKDKAEFDLRIYREREQIRALEAALNDIRARSGRTQEMVQRAYSDEQVFLDHVRKLKASFSGDRSRLEQEVQRVRAQLMQERQMREEAVHRESATLARYRASENPVCAVQEYWPAHVCAETLRARHGGSSPLAANAAVRVSRGTHALPSACPCIFVAWGVSCGWQWIAMLPLPSSGYAP